MGMSTHVYGFKPPDEKWQQMKAVYDASIAAGIDIPEAVYKFFNWSPPDEAGVTVKIDDAITPINESESQGFAVDLAKLPKDVTVLKFINRW